MTFEEYQKFTETTIVFPRVKERLIYLTLGLAGESGEVAEKVKKILRDKNGEMSEETKKDLIKEVGDVLWYISELSRELGFKLEDVAKINMEKLQSRKDRNQLHGDGDNR